MRGQEGTSAGIQWAGATSSRHAVAAERPLSRKWASAIVVGGLAFLQQHQFHVSMSLDEPAELVEIFDKIFNSAFDREILKATSFNFVARKFSMQEMASAYSSIYLE